MSGHRPLALVVALALALSGCLRGGFARRPAADGPAVDSIGDQRARGEQRPAPDLQRDTGLCPATDLCPKGQECYAWQPGDLRGCYQVCTVDSDCPGTHLCVQMTTTTQYCLRQCDPLGGPGVCAANEVCYADAKLLKSFCLPTSGGTGSCSTSSTCATGLICAAGSCLPLCDDTHKCTPPLTCHSLKIGGNVGPWKCCAPP